MGPARATLTRRALLLISFTIAGCVAGVQLSAAEADGGAGQGSSATTERLVVADPSATVAPTEPPDLATTTLAAETRSTAAATTAASAAAAAAGSTDEPEPMTSTTDTPDVNADEEAPGRESSANDDDDARLPGIEPKSISRDEPDANALAKSAELNIEAPGPSAASADKPARPALNMTLVDQVYTDGRIDEQESADNWNKLSKKLKKGVSGIIGAMVPFALNMSQEAKISGNCSGAMLKWILSMNQLKAWALRMLDASGKPIAGLLEGSMTMFGNYRQCLKVRAPDDDEIEFAGEFREYFRGKYCVIQAKPWLPEKSRFYNLNTKLATLVVNEEENEAYDQTIFDELSEWLLAFNFVNIRYDLCVPSLCSREDIQKAINYLLKGIDLKARVLRCEVDAPDGVVGLASRIESGSGLDLGGSLAAAAAAKNLTSGRLSLEAFSQLGWILIPLVAVTLVLIATALSLTLTSGDDNNSATGAGANQEKGSTTKFKRTIQSISLKRSVSSHLNIDYDQLADDKPLALYGIRFILVVWVILVESAVNLKFEYLRELMMLKDLIFWWPMQIIINSSLQYDSFILLTAFTMAYKNCLNDGINQTKAMTRFVLDKYVRLMPSIMVMAALVILLPLLYRGPVWTDYVARQSAVCQSTGWVNAVFMQNYLPFKDICLPQTWLLCVEFQLVLLMAPLLYYLNKSYMANYGGRQRRKTTPIEQAGQEPGSKALQEGARQAGPDSSRALYWLRTAPGLLLLACALLGLASSFYNVYYNELPPSWFYTMADPDSKALYFGEHMTRVWTHLAVFVLGLLAGVECRRMTRNGMRGYRGGNLGLLAHSDLLTKDAKPLSASSLHNSSVSININSSASAQGDNINGLARTDEAMLASSSVSANSNSDFGFYSGDSQLRVGPGWCSILLELMGFALAIAVMAAIIFSTHDWSMSDLPNPLVAGLFDVGSRLLWSLAMIWILYAVSVPNKRSGNHSPLARALGHPAMVCLGRLSFLIYIIHPFVHTTVLAIQEQPIYSSWLMMFHILLGNITITVILSSLVSLFVEMPCRNLFRRCGASLLLAQAAANDAGPAAGLG